MESQDPHWNANIYARIPWSLLVILPLLFSGYILNTRNHTWISVSTLEYKNLYWNLLKSQEEHWNSSFHIATLGFISESQNWPWNTRIHTGNLGSLSKSTDILRFTLQSLDLHWNPRIHTENPEYTLKSKDLYCNPKIYIVINGSSLKYQNPDWHLRIHTVVPRFTV